MKFHNVGNTLFLKDILDSSTFDELFEFREVVEEKPQNGYSPKRIRGTGSQREGYCEYCEKWYNMKNSSYWYHMNYKHGINCKGEKYPMPKLREVSALTQGYCTQCDEWICLGSTKKNYRFSWLRHVQKMHRKAKTKKPKQKTNKH